jgi:hypothetical protein
MSIKKLAMLAPALCDAQNASRFGAIAGLVFDHELSDKNSPFAENSLDKEDPYNRISPAFAWSAGIGYESKKRYIMDLVVYASKMHHLKEHKQDGLDAEVAILKQDLEAREPLYSDVKAIQPVAGVMGVWA